MHGEVERGKESARQKCSLGCATQNDTGRSKKFAFPEEKRPASFSQMLKRVLAYFKNFRHNAEAAVNGATRRGSKKANGGHLRSTMFGHVVDDTQLLSIGISMRTTPPLKLSREHNGICRKYENPKRVSRGRGEKTRRRRRTTGNLCLCTRCTYYMCTHVYTQAGHNDVPITISCLDARKIAEDQRSRLFWLFTSEK